MKAHLAGGQTTLAYLWKVKQAPQLGTTILGFTNHDLNITYDNGDGDGAITYAAASGFKNTAAAGKSDLSVDNMEVTGFLQSASLAEADLRAGRWDDATYTEMLVNWADLTMGNVIVRKGYLGIVKWKNALFTAELRGIADKLRTRLGATYGPVCRAEFGSGTNGIDMNSKYLCNFDVTQVQQTGSVTSVTDLWTLVPNITGSATFAGHTGPAQPAGWFNSGLIKFTSGVLNGLYYEIKVWDGTTLYLFLPMAAPGPSPGDTFIIEAGCNHLSGPSGDCQTKFLNIANFRAENDIPGLDTQLSVPNNV